MQDAANSNDKQILLLPRKLPSFRPLDTSPTPKALITRGLSKMKIACVLRPCVVLYCIDDKVSED
jgi:hypothetical protein